MSQHCKLTNQEFNDNANLFYILEIKAEQVVGKDYEALSHFLKKQRDKLILVNHPDKGGDKNRFDRIYKAHKELQKYIEPLESGNPCAKVSANAESDGRLTVREFYYRRKLFEKLSIIDKEAVGKNYAELILILKSKDLSFEKDLENYSKLISQISKILQDPSLDIFRRGEEIEKLTQELDQYQVKPGIQLFEYIVPLRKDGSLIEEDKKALALKFIERQNFILTRTQAWVVIHESEEILIKAKVLIEEWLKTIGLELKPSKTRISHTLGGDKPGFDFWDASMRQKWVILNLMVNPREQSWIWLRKELMFELSSA